MAETETPEITRVTAAILINDEKVIIAKRKSTGKLPNKWEFPGGKIENDETPEQCLKRELKEEFDIDVSIGEYLGSSIYHYDHISIELLAYLTFWEGGSISLKDLVRAVLRDDLLLWHSFCWEHFGVLNYE